VGLPSTEIEYDADNFGTEVRMQQPLEGAQLELGALLGEHRQGDTVLHLFRNGLFVQGRRGRFAGSFDDIRGLYVDDARRPFALKLTLPGRISVQFFGGDKETNATLRGLINRATAALLERCGHEYDHGQTVDCGAVRLSKQHIAVRRLVGWKRLPLARLSGWTMRDGWLFLDRGSPRPRRFAEVPLRRVANLPVLMALLRKARADADLSQPANALRHSARGRGWLSRPATALTRRPPVWWRTLGRWAVFAGVVTVCGYLAMRFDLLALARSFIDSLRALYTNIR
jgi:hypothetical protein